MAEGIRSVHLVVGGLPCIVLCVRSHIVVKDVRMKAQDHELAVILEQFAMRKIGCRPREARLVKHVGVPERRCEHVMPPQYSVHLARDHVIVEHGRIHLITEAALRAAAGYRPAGYPVVTSPPLRVRIQLENSVPDFVIGACILKVGMEGNFVSFVKASGQAGAVAREIFQEIRTEQRGGT